MRKINPKLERGGDGDGNCKQRRATEWGATELNGRQEMIFYLK